jgi:very-short-patch-repair endonuclease
VGQVSVKRARELRKSMTPQEVRLWVQLRYLRADGHHFRRQPPLLGYYPDFACFRHMLIVELDGSQHTEADQVAHDHRRDAAFARAGFRTLRFWNRDVDEDVDGVVRAILHALALPHPTPSGPPSP